MSIPEQRRLFGRRHIGGGCRLCRRLRVPEEGLKGNQAETRRRAKRLNPILDVELIVDVREVKVHRALGNHQAVRSFPAAVTLRDKTEHPHLGGRESHATSCFASSRTNRHCHWIPSLLPNFLPPTKLVPWSARQKDRSQHFFRVFLYPARSRTVYRAAGGEFRTQPDSLSIASVHFRDEGVDLVGMHESHARASESRAREARAHATRRGPSGFGHRIQLGTADLVVVSQALVAFAHESTHAGEVFHGEGFREFQAAQVLAYDVAGAHDFFLIKGGLASLEILLRNLAQAGHAQFRGGRLAGRDSLVVFGGF